MSKLIIIGAGGFGREVLAWCKMALPRIQIGGFLDDRPNASADTRLRAPVIATVEAYEPQADDVFVCAVGNTSLRKRLSTKIKERGGRFQTIVHPTAIVAEGANLESGVLICPYAIVSTDAFVKEGAAIYYHSSVDHDAVVGAWSQISAHCDITGGAKLGMCVFMGSHASILPCISVGEEAIVGAGAIVCSNVSPGAIVMGVPAREGKRDS